MVRSIIEVLIESMNNYMNISPLCIILKVVSLLAYFTLQCTSKSKQLDRRTSSKADKSTPEKSPIVDNIDGQKKISVAQNISKRSIIQLSSSMKKKGTKSTAGKTTNNSVRKKSDPQKSKKEKKEEKTKNVLKSTRSRPVASSRDKKKENDDDKIDWGLNIKKEEDQPKTDLESHDDDETKIVKEKMKTRFSTRRRTRKEKAEKSDYAFS